MEFQNERQFKTQSHSNLEFHSKMVLLFLRYCSDDATIKMTREPVKYQKENPTGCAGEDKHSEPVEEI